MTYLAQLHPASVLALLAVIGAVAGVAVAVVRDRRIEHGQDGWGDE